MLLFHNLEFYDKLGNNLNLKKINRIDVIIEDLVQNPDTDPHGSGAILEVITNYNHQIEDLIIIDGGIGYTDKTVISINDTITNETYKIEGSNFIIRDSEGRIKTVNIPTRKTCFSYPSVVYKGEMFFNHISVGLIESEHIYITEHVKTSNKNDMYVYPRNTYFLDGTYISNIIGSTLDGDPEIFLYDVKDKTEKHPLIEKQTQFSYPINNGLFDTLDNSYTRLIEETTNSVMQINIGVKADEEGIYENILRLQVIHNDKKYSFAEILFRAEVVGEDERLRHTLETFGFSLSTEDVKMFRDTDISEELPNYKLLNEKRKELLLEYHNIFPYIGSYKGLINILKYLDYSDLRIKEYWLNVEMANRNEMIPQLNYNEKYSSRIVSPDKHIKEKTSTNKIHEITKKDYLDKNSISTVSQNPVNISDMINFYSTYNYIPNNPKTSLRFDEKFYKQIDIPFELKGKGKNSKDIDFLPNKKWKKTSLFSLHYDINKATDEIDDGVPVVVDSFMFSEEEALIKLFSLKEFLKEKFLPLNARIIDIIGEGIYFTRYTINTWKDDVNTTYIEKEFQPSFNIDSSFLIEDLYDYGKKISNIELTDNIQKYYRNTLTNFYNHSNDIRNNLGPIGCIINLKCDKFELKWDACNISWDELNMGFNDVSKFEITNICKYGKIEFTDWYSGEKTNFFININLTDDIYSQWENVYNDLVSSTDKLISLFEYEIKEIGGSPLNYKIFAKSRDYNNRIGNILFLNGVSGIFKPNPAQGINTWDTIGQREFYELEWRITHEIPSKFTLKKRDRILSGKNTSIILPYTGKYKIELLLFDMTNHSVRTHKYINVKLPQIEISLLSRFMNYLDTWDDFEKNEIDWKSIGGDWRSPGIKNNVSWDDCDISWNDLDIRNHINIEPSEQFIPTENSTLLKISESDRYVGHIIPKGINFENCTIKCKGHFIQPKLRNSKNNIPQDYIFLRRDEIIFKTGIITADYSESGYTTIKVQNFPNGFNETWECLREIGGTILVENDIISKEYGLKENSYIKLKFNKYETPKEKRILINDIIDYENPGGISISQPISKIPGEYGKIYKIRNASSNGSGDTFDIITFSEGHPVKQIQLNYIPEEDEIIPGFTMIEMQSMNNGEPYLQRLLVQHINIIGTPEKYILDVIEIDGDFNINENPSIEYEYWQFNTKLVHYNSEPSSLYYENTNIELNFNDYPYHKDFLCSIGSPDTYILNGLWYFDYITRDGDFSLKVTNLGIEENNTLITVDDENSELYRCGPQFNLSWITFDEDYAERRIGTEILSWENFDEVTWNELKHLQWQQLEYVPGNSCGFEITKIAPNGTIRFNELPEFVFTNIPLLGYGTPNITEYDQWKAAVNELNNTDNPGMTKFNFTLVTLVSSPVKYKILATSKTRNIDSLGYLVFGNGIEGIHSDPTMSHTYPLGYYNHWNNPHIFGYENLYANWLPTARTYYEYGFNSLNERGWYPAIQYINTENILSSKIFTTPKISFLYPEIDDETDPIYNLPYGFPSLLKSVDWKFAEGMRCLYDNSISGPFTWNDFYTSSKPSIFKPMTTVFFILPNCKIAGKNKYKWQIKDRTANKILCETKEKELIWTFSYESIYDISLEIEDINGNKQSITKNAFITIE